MADIRELMGSVGTAIDAAGVIVIVVGAVVATRHFFFRRPGEAGALYQLYRQDLGRAILLGLEFLIAGDIIRTVIVAPTLENVAVLGMIVLIRTFLSTALQLEIEGHWPWQAAARSTLPQMPQEPESHD